MFQVIIGHGYEPGTIQQYDKKMLAALVAKTPCNISDGESAGIHLAMMAVATQFYHPLVSWSYDCALTRV